MIAPAVSFEPLSFHTLAHLDVAAASGIALHADRLYVIADDELELGVYACDGIRTGSIPLQTGVLPTDSAQRKASKPDYEALLSLPDGSLLALGSGSTARRMRGAWIRFEAAANTVHEVDLTALYTELLQEHPELNIEGGVVWQDALYLSSRGNGALHDNALICLDVAHVCESLARSHTLSAASLRTTQRVSLPQLEGTALSFTDLSVADGQLLFAAAAEASPNTYDDGVCVGSVLGALSLAGQIEGPLRVTPRLKIEGMCAQHAEHGLRLWLVADADDRQARAPLMAADWPKR